MERLCQFITNSITNSTQNMSNSQVNPKMPILQDDAPIEDQSDSQTIEYSNSSYEYLINQIKMKSSALTKASNLIEILQLELQVQKSSRNEAVLTAQQEIKDVYEIEIANLTAKIDMLESSAQKRHVSIVYNSQKNTDQPKLKHDSRVLRRIHSKSLNRSKSKDNKNFMLSPKKEDFASQLSLEFKVYRKMLIESSIWDGKFLQEFQNLVKTQQTDITNVVRSMQKMEQDIEHVFSQSIRNPRKTNSIVKIQQLFSIIHKQTTIIQDMKVYESQLEDIIKGLAYKINGLLEQKFNKYMTQLQIPDLTDIMREVLEIASRWEQMKKAREQRLESQNKELRQIVEEMISLMNKKKHSKDYRSLAN